MKKLIKYISIIALFIGMSSCSDFLDKEPSYSLNEANAITNYTKAQAAVGGIYRTLINDAGWSGSYYVSLASKAGFVDWSPGDFNMEYSQQNETTSSISARWSTYYKSLNAANFAINGIENLSDAQVPSPADRDALVAEARCLRAWININLFWNYGHWWSTDDSNPNGILYRDQVTNLSNIEKARSTVGESYQKIFEDLDYAIANMGSYKGNRYLSKTFAKVLKAKILLYRGGLNDTSADLTEALSLVNDVLGNSPAGFSMQSDLAQVYADSWDSDENLFVSYLEDDGRRTYSASFMYSYSMSQIYGDRIPLAPGATLTAGLNYGVDWFKADPRWDIVTGESRASETWDTSMRYTWTKVTRLSRYAGQQASPPDEKYNTYYFRYPELYIMKSELLARTGASIADAIAPINQMRSIRTNPSLPALNPGTEQELMDAIFKEYFLETFLENGSEFFASLRFKTAGQPWIVTIKGGQALDMNKLCYPIPNSEMTNNLLMTQNTDLE